MSLFDHPDFDEHEHVSHFSDPESGLRAIIAIHRTGALGTAGGGCRIWPYRDDDEAVRDALRLSRAMTYKMALVEIPVGGGKAIVISRPSQDRRALLHALGRAVDRLGGRFIVSEDVGTSPDDMNVIGETTLWVNKHGGGFADTATATAYAVFVGVRATVKRRLGRDDLRGLRVAVQGVGRVGTNLCRHLAQAGAKLVVTDVHPELVERVVRELGATPVAPPDIFDQDVDVFSPCAMADALDAGSIARLKAKVVAGSANNQLAHTALADELSRREILYAPDVVINAGGALGAASAIGGDDETIKRKLDTIGPLLDAVFSRAERERLSTHAAAERIARERMKKMGIRP